jgi:hypothetical protein
MFWEIGDGDMFFDVSRRMELMIGFF